MYLIHVNERILLEGGYKDLEKVLRYRPVDYNKKCRSKCGYESEEYTTLNLHICISLDVREPTNKLRTMEGHLNDFPPHLYLQRPYRLVGIIHHEPGLSLPNVEEGHLQTSEPGHFSAYILLTTGSWIHCDDLEENINYACKPSQTVKPHAAIYVICETECDI
ncbi:uncharacterized protein LOC126765752 [Bactrocera neohumeralis]|uniref:uncharacterized protein LOC126765752 n=1 Tax=Bactrocera neohumeralis TaxID=98809 RepID=UPI0021669FC2|nr:uncharacterized protein LOC126765752 [Bactrocera neohumeralis]